MLLAAIDPTLFTAVVTFLLGGGIVTAWTAYRKTPVEVESISVTTLRAVIQELRTEVGRLSTENAELRTSIEELRTNSKR